MLSDDGVEFEISRIIKIEHIEESKSKINETIDKTKQLVGKGLKSIGIDTFSPKLQEIEEELNGIMLEILEETHNEYIEIQKPLVPYKSGNLLESMFKTNLEEYPDELILEFGFYADAQDRNSKYESFPYAELQEENYPNKVSRYPNHTPIINYFQVGFSMSSRSLEKVIDEQFKILFR